MTKKKLFLPAILMLMSISVAHAQSAYVSVQQNDAAVTAVGTAAFDLSSTPTLEFVDGKAVMKVGSNTVAKLPMSDGGQLAVEFTNNSGNTAGSLPVTVSSVGYGTLYSPFQLSVPTGSDVKVYAPSYDDENHVLNCNSSTEVAESAIIPVGTALLLKNAGTITFGFSDGAATDSHVSALSGSALTIAKADVSVVDGSVIYTLGHEASDNTKFGFFEYSGDNLSAGKAYLVAPRLNQLNAKYITFNFDDDAAGLNEVSSPEFQISGKYIENGHIVILKNGRKYNLNGQEIK